MPNEEVLMRVWILFSLEWLNAKGQLERLTLRHPWRGNFIPQIGDTIIETSDFGECFDIEGRQIMLDVSGTGSEVELLCGTEQRDGPVTSADIEAWLLEGWELDVVDVTGDFGLEAIPRDVG
jgi:hypothetical protein